MTWGPLMQRVSGTALAPVSLDSEMLVNLVNDGYRDHKEWWSFSAASVLRGQLYRLCKADVNKHRSEKGLPLVAPTP